MFIDASALTAILSGEPDAEKIQDKLLASDQVFISPIAVWETVLALVLTEAAGIGEVRAKVDSYLAEAKVIAVQIGGAEQEAALDAHTSFGKGRHPARLNMGDCFAYACAKTHGVPLLFKGEDFTRTDIEIA